MRTNTVVTTYAHQYSRDSNILICCSKGAPWPNLADQVNLQLEQALKIHHPNEYTTSGMTTVLPEKFCRTTPS